jgi:hypothetical protein
MKKNPSVYVPVLHRTVELGKPVFHHRFLWHITYNLRSLNLLIAKQGINLPFNGAVYAHNELHSFEYMYPYFVDRHDWFMGPSRYRCDGAQFDRYSFWRIDTQKSDFSWYLDPGMFSDADYLGVSKHHYLCTPQSIAPRALRLYNFDLDNYIFRNPKIRYENGSAHIRPVRDDFDTLVPNEEVNRYIRSKAA